MEVPEGRDGHAAAGTTLGGVALPDLQGHLHRHRGHASGATVEVVAVADKHRHEPAGEGRGPAPSAPPEQAVTFVAQSLADAATEG
jgi:hypothetical protein